MLPKISVIIPTYNRRQTLRRAVESVLNQTFRDFELIVVDDGSSDGTHEDWQSCPNVTYLKQSHGGVSKARNAGIVNSRSQFIAFLDSDDEWKPEKLARQLHFFETHPDSLISQTEEIWIRRGKRVNPMKKHKKYGGLIFKECLPLCIVSPSAVMMKRELFHEIGYFDETLPACEDYDMWLRVSAKYPIDLIEEPLVIKYGGHPDQLSRTVPFLDRYRIQALQKIMESGTLSEEQFGLAIEEFKRKCEIYGKGCLKRGKSEEAKRVLQMPWGLQTWGQFSI